MLDEIRFAACIQWLKFPGINFSVSKTTEITNNKTTFAAVVGVRGMGNVCRRHQPVRLGHPGGQQEAIFDSAEI